jgi:hypothetical protein
MAFPGTFAKNYKVSTTALPAPVGKASSIELHMNMRYRRGDQRASLRMVVTTLLSIPDVPRPIGAVCAATQSVECPCTDAHGWIPTKSCAARPYRS